MSKKSLIVVAGLLALAVGLVLHPVSQRFLLGRLYNNIGVLYAGGVLGDHGAENALPWFQDGANLGCAAAAFNLGFAYQNGRGTAADEVAAKRWYTQAAEAGVALAANNLAILYANPSTGRPRLALARYWLVHAARLADGELSKTVATSLEQMERDMTPAQLAAGDDALRAAAVDEPPPPRVIVPMSDAQVRAQVTAALLAAAPLRETATRYIQAHHQLPLSAAIASDPAFRPVETAAARVAIGNGAMVQIVLRGGPYGGAEFGWIPLYRNEQLSWICAHGHVPGRYFGASCR
ncbi:MAG: pilin [Pseudomonadota bacterium]